METTRALASLLSSRMSELDVSPGDIAGDLEVSAATVDEWLAGSAVPEQRDIVSLARILSLPRSLLREAYRRAEHDLKASEMSGDPTDPEALVTGNGGSAPTHEQDVPAAVMPAAVVDAPPAPLPTESTFVRLGSPWRMLTDRMARQRSRTRAPTRELSYVEEPAQRTTYQLRAMLTAGGVIAMVIILRWALRGFGSALADLWETLTGAL